MYAPLYYKRICFTFVFLLLYITSVIHLDYLTFEMNKTFIFATSKLQIYKILAFLRPDVGIEWKYAILASRKTS